MDATFALLFTWMLEFAIHSVSPVPDVFFNNSKGFLLLFLFLFFVVSLYKNFCVCQGIQSSPFLLFPLGAAIDRLAKIKVHTDGTSGVFLNFHL